jgi:6,7-dimethyl-8-ribityllumazine synthase
MNGGHAGGWATGRLCTESGVSARFTLFVFLPASAYEAGRPIAQAMSSSRMPSSYSIRPAPQGQRVALLLSQTHAAMVDVGRQGFEAHWAALGRSASSLERMEVPGAFELPLHAKLLAEKGRFAAVVCAALVVDGGPFRYDHLAHAVAQGLMQVQLSVGVPLLSMVLVPNLELGAAYLDAAHPQHDHAVAQCAERMRAHGQQAAQAAHITLDGIASIVGGTG